MPSSKYLILSRPRSGRVEGRWMFVQPIVCNIFTNSQDEDKFCEHLPHPEEAAPGSALRGWARIAVRLRRTWFETRPDFAGTLLTMR
jgi:hypothetical protein